MADNNLKPEKKKASKKKKASESLPTLNSERLETTPAEQQAMQEMIQLARLEYLKSLKDKVFKEKKREISSLDDQIKEFLGPYLLIGYDLNERPVEIISASTAAEHDALLERFRRLSFKINQNIVNSNGEDPYGNNGDGE